MRFEDRHKVEDAPTEFDRSGRGFPNFGYRLRKLERRVHDLEAQLNRRSDAEHTNKEKTDDRDANR